MKTLQPVSSINEAEELVAEFAAWDRVSAVSWQMIDEWEREEQSTFSPANY